MPALIARRETCDALVCFMSAGEVIKLTKLGRFRMDQEAGGVVGLLKKLRGGKTNDAGDKVSAGARQLANAETPAENSPLYSRHSPGCARLLLDDAVLARGLWRQYG